jgi:dipeptidyl aminopeptidase/acylaminoacyl peptidase
MFRLRHKRSLEKARKRPAFAGWRRRFVTIAVFLPSLIVLSKGQAQTPRRPMQFEDLMKMRRLGDLDLSPDGRWALFTVTDVDLARNTRTPHLWVAPVDGGQQRPLTASQAGESGGRFSPDGKKVLFVSARNGVPQIFVANFDESTGNVDEEQGRPLTTLSTGASGAIWSPDGANILFLSDVYPDCGGTPEQEDDCNRQRDAEKAKSQVQAQIFTHLLVRHWNAFTGDKRSHLFLVPAAGGQARDLTPGIDHDIPPFSLGEPQGYIFSPDSKEIAFEWNTDPVPAISTNSDLFTLDLTSPDAKPVRISTSPGADLTPRYSPDGRYIAFRSQSRAGYESDRFRLMLYDRQQKQIHELLSGFDHWVDDLAWAPDSKTIYFVSGVTSEEPIFQVSVSGTSNDSDLTRLTELGGYGDLHPTADGQRLVVTRTTVRQPAEVYVLRTRQDEKADASAESRPEPNADTRGEARADAHGHRPSPAWRTILLRQDQLTHLNTALLETLDLPEMESFWFTGAQRTRVQGFVIRPPGFDAQKKYPVKFLIHGGPEGAWENSWSYRWNPELFAADGYVVVMVNPRGSTGYGQNFIDGINGDWGGKPYLDLMRGLDHAETAYPFIDKSRECALGASYGGFMADWILGHTDRFACIVTHDGMFDPEAFYGTTDELWFPEWEFKGTPWGELHGGHSLYRRWSPMLYAANFKTPTLIIHGQLDYRLDVSQGLALFTTLQRMHVPSEMLYFPDEGHWVLKPQNSQLWNKTISDWCNKYTKTTPPQPAPALAAPSPQ